MRTLLAFVLAGALVAPANSSALAQQGAPPGIGIGLAEAPAERREDPRAHVYIIDHVDPGTSFSRRIRVSNGTDEPRTVSLVTAAASIVDGTFLIAEGDGQNELSAWLSVAPGAVALDPGEIGEATVTVEVPEDATDGERYAAVVASSPTEATGPITLESRVGLRVYLSVGEGQEPPSDFEVDTLTARRDAAGVPVVDAEVRNTGQRALDLRGELTLEEGPAGLSAGPFRARVPTTLGPGERGQVTVELDPALPAGPWRARLTVRSGTLARAAEATIVFPEGAGEASEPVEATEVPLLRDRGFLLPLAIVLVSLVVIGLALFWWFVVRRRGGDDGDGRKAARKHAGVTPRE